MRGGFVCEGWAFFVPCIYLGLFIYLFIRLTQVIQSGKQRTRASENSLMEQKICVKISGEINVNYTYNNAWQLQSDG